MLLVSQLNESRAWVPPKSRQVEKFPPDIVLCAYESTERVGPGWVGGECTAFCQRITGHWWTGPRVTVLGKWPKLEGVQLMQRGTESAGSPRANTDVTASGQRKCRDQKATGHTRYEV